MRKLLIAIMFMVCSAALYGAVQNSAIVKVSNAPSGACVNGVNGQLVIPTGEIWTCQSNVWAALSGGGSGSGTVSSGSGYAFPAYANGAGTTIGPSNITTDATGNNLNVPGNVVAGTAVQTPQIIITGNGMSLFQGKPAPVAFFPGNGSCTIVTATQYHAPSCTPSATMIAYIADPASDTDCTVGGGNGTTYKPHQCQYTGSAWVLPVIPYAMLSGAPSALPPNGSASGDLSGSYPGPTVAKVNGNTPGNTCTNQFTRSINSSAQGTCASIAAADLPTITLAEGTTHSISVTSGEMWECTGTCTVTPPSPVAGQPFCVRQDTGVTTVITLAAISGVYYEHTDHSAYGTINATMTSAAAGNQQICMVGRDTTHWQVASYAGTWTAN